jgi:hypothetical protein
MANHLRFAAALVGSVTIGMSTMTFHRSRGCGSGVAYGPRAQRPVLPLMGFLEILTLQGEHGYFIGNWCQQWNRFGNRRYVSAWRP